MPTRKAIFLKKTITSPLVIKEIELIEQETKKGYNTILYDMIVEKVHEIIREREMGGCIVNDKLTMNVLKYEVNRVLNKYPITK